MSAPAQSTKLPAGRRLPHGRHGLPGEVVRSHQRERIVAAIVTTVKVSKEHKGRYGTRSIATIPKIANGVGSVTGFSLTFAKKLFPYKGEKHGYILAKCSDGHFAAEAELKFIGGTHAKGKIVRACTPKG